MNTKKRIILISAELSSLTSPENDQRTSSLKNLLTNKKYNFGQVLGSYKGSLEKSFIVDASEDVVKPLQLIASVFKQESILVVDELQNATLLYGNGKIEKIGTMSQVNSINGLGSWSLVNGLFYTVK